MVPFRSASAQGIRTGGQEAFAVGLLLACSSLSAPAPPPEPRAGPEFPVTMAVAAEKLDGRGDQRLTITLKIGKGYHLLANPTENNDLPPSIHVKVTGKSLAREGKALYPQGELIEDKLVGNYRIYTGTVSITVLVKRRPGNRHPLLVTARVRPFNSIGCVCQTRELKEEVP